MTTSIKQILDALEPLPAHASVDTLGERGLEALANVSIAISLKRIADAAEKAEISIDNIAVALTPDAGESHFTIADILKDWFETYKRNSS